MVSLDRESVDFAVPVGRRPGNTKRSVSVKEDVALLQSRRLQLSYAEHWSQQDIKVGTIVDYAKPQWNCHHNKYSMNVAYKQCVCILNL